VTGQQFKEERPDDCNRGGRLLDVGLVTNPPRMKYFLSRPSAAIVETAKVGVVRLL
jgi:hypothetical protein